ncbi:hypothetical protein PYCC9005_001808 [Savitreella phatthalungensis]
MHLSTLIQVLIACGVAFAAPGSRLRVRAQDFSRAELIRRAGLLPNPTASVPPDKSARATPLEHRLQIAKPTPTPSHHPNNTNDNPHASSGVRYLKVEPSGRPTATGQLDLDKNPKTAKLREAETDDDYYDDRDSGDRYDDEDNYGRDDDYKEDRGDDEYNDDDERMDDRYDDDERDNDRYDDDRDNDNYNDERDDDGYDKSRGAEDDDDTGEDRYSDDDYDPEYDDGASDHPKGQLTRDKVWSVNDLSLTCGAATISTQNISSDFYELYPEEGQVGQYGFPTCTEAGDGFGTAIAIGLETKDYKHMYGLACQPKDEETIHCCKDIVKVTSTQKDKAGQLVNVWGTCDKPEPTRIVDGSESSGDGDNDGDADPDNDGDDIRPTSSADPRSDGKDDDRTDKKDEPKDSAALTSPTNPVAAATPAPSDPVASPTPAVSPTPK